MATYYTRPKPVEKVTAIRLDHDLVQHIAQLVRDDNFFAGDYIVQKADGSVGLMSKLYFEQEYEANPPLPILGEIDLNPVFFG
jgi:hypothetical protein